MKFVFLILFVIFINTVKSQSTAQILNGCQIRRSWSGKQRVECMNFQHTYLPYTEEFKQAAEVYMVGNFTELVIDSAYENLEDINIFSKSLQKFKFENYASFTKLSSVAVSGSKRVVNVDFTGVEKFKRLYAVQIDLNKMVKLENSCESFRSSNIEHITLDWNKFDSFDFSCVPRTMKTLDLHYNKISTLDSPSCEALKNLPNLTKLILSGNKFTDFNFTCLPKNLVYLRLGYNQISTISAESCQSLKRLTSLRLFDLSSNRLQNFQFGCLPTSIKSVNLYKNNITDFNDLSDIPLSHSVYLNINSNPIRCTCSFLRDYVQKLDSNNVSFYADYGSNFESLTCANTDSELANYPWSNNATDIKLHDASSLGCLTNGENTDSDID